MEYGEAVREFEEFFSDSWYEQVAKAVQDGKNSIVVDFRQLDLFNPELCEYLEQEPSSAIDAAEEGVMGVDIVSGEEFCVRFTDMPEEDFVRIRNLRSDHIGKFVPIEGMIKRASQVRPEVVSAIFECTQCGDRYEKEQDSSELKSPYKCDCGSRKFEVEEKVMTDTQNIVVEENPESREGAEQPATINVRLEADLVDPDFQKKVVPGNVAHITGIVRETPFQKNSRKFDMYMEANYLDPTEQEYEELELNDEQREEIEKLSEQEDIFDQLARSIAPSIYGHHQIKKAIALQLFSGVKKTREDGVTSRGDIHILLIGEPGTGKCVAPDTEILDSKGGKEEIGKLVEERLADAEEVKEIDDGYYVEEETGTWGLDQQSRIEQKTASKMWKREAPEKMYRIKTGSGRELEVTPSHPLFIQKHGKVAAEKASELEEGSFIAAPRKLEAEGNTNTDVVPNTGELLRTTREKLGMTQFDFTIDRGSYHHYERLDRNPSRGNLQDIVESFRRRKGEMEEMVEALENPDWETVKQVRKKLGISQQQIAANASRSQTLIGGYERGEPKGENKELLAEVAQLLQSEIRERVKKADPGIQRLQLLSSSDIFWDEIVEIESVEPDYDWVYDLEIPEQHNYITNGIVSHNSQILQFSGELAPKGRYVVGKSSTGAGLTAAAVRNEETGEFELEAGAIVLANKGLAAVDEIDKMGSEDRSSLHEAMEQQQISVAKANIQATLNAETSILAAGNPKLGRFDPYEPIPQQIELGDTLLSRFDFIFPVKDEPDEERDQKLSRQVLQNHIDPEETDAEIGQEMLRNYVAYARKNIRPELTKEAADSIQEFYVNMREGGTEEGESVPITARQLEALIRVAEASARAELREEVVEKDAQRAIDILTYCLQQIGVDPETGDYDIDMIESGVSSSQRNRLQTVKQIIRSAGGEEDPVEVEQVLEAAEEQGMEKNRAEEIINRLKREGDLWEPQPGHIQQV